MVDVNNIRNTEPSSSRTSSSVIGNVSKILHAAETSGMGVAADKTWGPQRLSHGVYVTEGLPLSAPARRKEWLTDISHILWCAFVPCRGRLLSVGFTPALTLGLSTATAPGTHAPPPPSPPAVAASPGACTLAPADVYELRRRMDLLAQDLRQQVRCVCCNGDDSTGDDYSSRSRAPEFRCVRRTTTLADLRHVLERHAGVEAAAAAEDAMPSVPGPLFLANAGHFAFAVPERLPDSRRETIERTFGPGAVLVDRADFTLTGRSSFETRSTVASASATTVVEIHVGTQATRFSGPSEDVDCTDGEAPRTTRATGAPWVVPVQTCQPPLLSGHWVFALSPTALMGATMCKKWAKYAVGSDHNSADGASLGGTGSTSTTSAGAGVGDWRLRVQFTPTARTKRRFYTPETRTLSVPLALVPPPCTVQTEVRVMPTATWNLYQKTFLAIAAEKTPTTAATAMPTTTTTTRPPPTTAHRRDASGPKIPRRCITSFWIHGIHPERVGTVLHIRRQEEFGGFEAVLLCDDDYKQKGTP